MEKTVGDVFGLCAGQQIGVGLAKRTANITPLPPLFIYADSIWQVCAEKWEKVERQNINGQARPVAKQNWPECCQFLTLKGGCCCKQLGKKVIYEGRTQSTTFIPINPLRISWQS